MPICMRCREDKITSQFSQNNKQCKSCKAEMSRIWRRQNPEKAAAANRRAYLKNQTQRRQRQREINESRREENRRYARDYRARNIDLLRAKDRARSNRWRDIPGHVRRAYHVKHFYGLSSSEYHALIDQQNNRCAICNKEQEGGLRVDHDHASKRARLLLCDPCNVGLGKFRDNIALMSEAIDYLSRNYHELPLVGSAIDLLSKAQVNQIRRLYGMTASEYAAWYIAQDGACAICKEKPRGVLCVDHSHESKIVRGLLCRTCNLGLGNFKDDVGLIATAIRYLEKHQ